MSSEEREREKMTCIVATYVSACCPRAAHTLRSDQNFAMSGQVQFHKIQSGKRCNINCPNLGDLKARANSSIFFEVVILFFQKNY
jgi:hypothetical protein